MACTSRSGSARTSNGYRCRVEPNPHVETFGKRAICLDRLLDQRSNLDALEIEDRFARLHFFDIENVIEQPNEPLAVRVCDREQAACADPAASRPHCR